MLMNTIFESNCSPKVVGKTRGCVFFLAVVYHFYRFQQSFGMLCGNSKFPGVCMCGILGVFDLFIEARGESPHKCAWSNVLCRSRSPCWEETDLDFVHVMLRWW